MFQKIELHNGGLLMEINKVSLMEAYMIETLRSNGLTDQEILTQIEKKDISPWENLHTKFDFNDLIKLAEQNHKEFEAIILNGYQVKFVTFNGLKTLLKLKFNLLEEQDYQLTEKGITDLKITGKQLTKIKQVLSENWVIEGMPSETSDHKAVKIELA